jgi:hypothetical protein
MTLICRIAKIAEIAKIARIEKAKPLKRKEKTEAKHGPNANYSSLIPQISVSRVYQW